MKKDITQFIYKNRFKDAQEIIKNINPETRSDYVLNVVYDNPTICFYTFLISMLLNNNSAHTHELASDVLSFPLSFNVGSYNLGLYHARKTLALDPLNTDYKTYLFLFHDLPEHLVHAGEAIALAKEVLKVDPSNEISINLIEKYKDKAINTKPPHFTNLTMLTSNTQQFYIQLYYAEFDAAYELVKNLSDKELLVTFAEINHQKPTLTTYGYFINSLMHNESAQLHYLASTLLINQLHTINGNLISGKWHATKAIELEPNNDTFIEWLKKIEIILSTQRNQEMD